MNRLKIHPIIKTKGKVELSPESIALVKVQAPRDIMGNRKYQLNPEGFFITRYYSFRLSAFF